MSFSSFLLSINFVVDPGVPIRTHCFSSRLSLSQSQTKLSRYSFVLDILSSRGGASTEDTAAVILLIVVLSIFADSKLFFMSSLSPALNPLSDSALKKSFGSELAHAALKISPSSGAFMPLLVSSSSILIAVSCKFLFPPDVASIIVWNSDLPSLLLLSGSAPASSNILNVFSLSVFCFFTPTSAGMLIILCIRGISPSLSKS